MELSSDYVPSSSSASSSYGSSQLALPPPSVSGISKALPYLTKNQVEAIVQKLREVEISNGMVSKDKSLTVLKEEKLLKKKDIQILKKYWEKEGRYLQDNSRHASAGGMNS